jgi:LPXTG-site transpeptidase (sortase) family protein
VARGFAALIQVTGRGAPRPRGALPGLVAGILLALVPVLWGLFGAAGPIPAPPRAVAATSSAAATAAANPAPAAPVWIQVPGIGVDTPVLPVGVDERGEMAVPPDVRTVGWYRFGPGPGAAAGSSVLAGHVDDREQGRGAFYRLVELTVGEPVRVRLADGTELGYRVAVVDRVAKSSLPVEQLFARDGRPRLVLITCGGEFDRAAGRFRDNVVVVAEPDRGPP